MKKTKPQVKLIALIIVAAIFGTLFLTGLPVSKLFGYYDIAPVKDLINYGLDFTGGIYIVLEADESEGEVSDDTLDKAIATIRTRIDSMGVSEPTITKQGTNQIRISIPDVTDQQEALEMVGKTAQLEFIDPDGNVILTGNDVKSSTYDEVTDETGLMAAYSVKLTFNDAGSDVFEKETSEHIDSTIRIVLDGEVISNPQVRETITGGEAWITGLQSKDEAVNLATLIRAGALPVDFDAVHVETIGPTLGEGSLAKSLIAGAIGVVLVMLFMAVVYRLPGIAADIALALYVIIYLYFMAAMKVTLTLTGVAGIILSIGMAVDSNVIIFERIKEELSLGKSVKTAVNAGFSRALATILDANVTTIIAGACLFLFGSGSVQGFAATLIIGVLVSLITAVFFTKRILIWIIDIMHIENGKAFGMKEAKGFNLPIFEKSKAFVSVALVILLICAGASVFTGFNLGIDFAGGSIIQVDMHETFEVSDIKALMTEFDDQCDITTAGDDRTYVVISSSKDFSDEEKNAIMDKFGEEYGLVYEDLLSFNKVAPSIGKDLQKQALTAALVTVIGILIYITFRFEFFFGVAAVIALIHDLLIVVGIYSIFKLPVNSSFIAALLTILGYSINNTIVVFDRVRENRSRFGTDIKGLINTSVNQTFTRSLYTTITTLLAVCALYIFGVSSIREFSLPMIIGFVAGLYSSVFLAANVWNMVKKKEAVAVRTGGNAGKKNSKKK
ncbi:MAG: protein translocase subunit SecD [Eubacteriaceae bacterium]|nr:protein translocase subunit SecD [Eubacteriaceae bacterium]